jgi:hypothetical protein
VVQAVRPPLPSLGFSLPHLTPANFFRLGDEMGCHGRDGVPREGGVVPAPPRRADWGEVDPDRRSSSTPSFGMQWRTTPSESTRSHSPAPGSAPSFGMQGGRPPPDPVVVWGRVRPHQVVGWSGVEWMRTIVALGLAQFGPCETTEARSDDEGVCRSGSIGNIFLLFK